MYFCAFALLPFFPLLYLVCQVLTTAFYSGRWRRWSLAPILALLAATTPLFFYQTPVATAAVVIGAPSAGLFALGCVWFAYTRSPEAALSVEKARAAANSEESTS
ncbi:MAG: hypothetical protein AB8H80_04605 [Planctomycetota bacterium]